jgi:hypothetical protein
MHLPEDVLHAVIIVLLVLGALLILRQPDEPRDLAAQVLREILVEEVGPQRRLGLLSGLAAVAELLAGRGVVLGEEAVLAIER